MVNADKEVFANYYHRSALFLTLIAGKDVDDWVDQQREILCVNVEVNHHSQQSRSHWTNLKKAFTDAFTNSAVVLEATQAYNALHMEGGAVDIYCATFECLRKIAGFTENDPGTILKF